MTDEYENHSQAPLNLETWFMEVMDERVMHSEIECRNRQFSSLFESPDYIMENPEDMDGLHEEVVPYRDALADEYPGQNWIVEFTRYDEHTATVTMEFK